MVMSKGKQNGGGAFACQRDPAEICRGGYQPPDFIVQHLRKLCGRILSSPTMVMSKDKQNSGAQLLANEIPPKYVGEAISLPILLSKI